MKKLTFGEVQVKIVEAACNYCGESNKKCFETVYPDLFYYVKTNEKLEYVLSDPKYETIRSGLFNQIVFTGYTSNKSCYKFTRDARDSEIVKEKINTHVCFDCARQMNKYLQNLKSI